MIKSEKGFILPITIVISLMAFIIFVHQLTLYEIDKRFSIEIQQLYILENIMQMAVSDVTAKIDTGEISSFGNIMYEDGTVSYSMAMTSPEVVRVIVTCRTTIEREYKSQFFYDLSKKEITQWFEYR
ncbi:hypothetical protein LCL95_11830 [Bacillus timonensis]|nr:hypothetical protein [Bacillus timonensis]